MTTQTHDLALAEPRVLDGANPFEVDPQSDFLADPLHDVPSWSETMFFLVWSPDAGVGVWIHAGVVPTDKTMWWAQTFAMLPGGVVLVDRSFGRPPDRSGPSTGNLEIAQTEPGRRWLLRFDGAGELSSTDALASRPGGAGVAVPFRFEFELEPVVPIYDMHAALGRHDLDWGGVHFEQGLRATGHIRALGREWRVDGAAIRDHSRGARDFTHFGGHVWNYTVWPQCNRALCVFNMWRPQSNSVATSVVMIMDEGRTEICSDFRITGSTEPGGQPRDLELSILRPDGSQLDLAGEVVHNVTMTYAVPNHNLNGNWGDPAYGLGDPIVADESVVAWRWPDGEIGIGNFERGFRPSILPRPEIPLPPGSVFAR